MDENSKTRAELDMVLKRKPNFFIRWGLIVFVIIVTLLFLLTYYTVPPGWPTPQARGVIVHTDRDAGENAQ